MIVVPGQSFSESSEPTGIQEARWQGWNSKKRVVLEQKDFPAVSGNFTTHKLVFQLAKTVMGREAS